VWFQDDFSLKIDEKEGKIMELQDALQLSRREYEEMESDKDRIIADRDMEIEQLQKKMEDMSSEFAEMLKVRPVLHCRPHARKLRVVCGFGEYCSHIIVPRRPSHY
jgi:predicted RNase H-like nuclease (RuvC/YqgF family)